ncbi:hypothetical protein DTS73_21345 [Salmonella enterica]|nr:hypothetical protein [Salmonella enterica]EAQ1209663.1 hypothetical protein [Salmonella enterica]EAR0627719.1 hypothetical protein [Salmonella enterica]EBN9890153.1 hypothetical protein [Salmonella enterica]EBO4688329.1 hypothetical protein [Salmonella enterica]
MSAREPPFIAITLILNQVIDVGKLMGALGGDSGPDLSFGLTLAISNAYRLLFRRSLIPRLFSLMPLYPVC